jgi:hypothetical protein
MPIELKDEGKFLEIAKKADSCRVKRSKDEVKLKLRTKNELYVFKTSPAKAEELTKKIDINIVEL